MQLTNEQVKHFYSIWLPLLNYVNEQRDLVPTFAESWAASEIDVNEEAIPLRDALWADDSLRAGFIAENPAQLSPDDLAIVESWQHRLSGNFFIERYLKKYAVLVGSKNNVYGVLGLTTSIEEMFYGQSPLYVKTVLIPFGDCIIYDTIMGTYNVSFGGGYKADLKETYTTAQERGGVITQLPHNPTPNKTTVRAGNKKVLTALKRNIGGKGMSARKAEEHVENIATFAKDFLLAQSPPVFLLDITPGLIEQYANETEKINWVSFKRLVWFLRDTGRIYYEVAEDMLEMIEANR